MFPKPMLISFAIAGLLLIFAYLLGSIPTGYLAGRYLMGIDIREHGSGSTGATNVLRTLGNTAGAAVLAIDMLKGAIAVALVDIFYEFVPNATNYIPTSWQPWLVTGAALAAVLGHSKSIWLNFTGGKSVATSLGVLLVMNPIVALGTLASFGIIIVFSRIVSISSIGGAIAVNILMVSLQQPLPYLIFALVAGIYVIVRHRSNIDRLLAGTEPKLGQKSEVA
jgi:acyl phosphate:glycerol-3-phosphate acyltransferase